MKDFDGTQEDFVVFQTELTPAVGDLLRRFEICFGVTVEDAIT